MPRRQKSKYKKMQREADSELATRNKTFIDKIMRRDN
jgi:hypothetical protein